MLKAGPGGVARVKKLVDRAGPRLKELGLENGLVRLEEYVRSAERVNALALERLKANRETIRIHRGSQSVSGRVTKVAGDVITLRASAGGAVEIPMDDVAAEDVVKFAGLLEGKAEGALKASQYYLVRGNVSAARELTRKLVAEGAERLLEDIESFAEVLPPAPRRSARTAVNSRKPGPERSLSGAEAESAQTPQKKLRPGANKMAWTRKIALTTLLATSDFNADDVVDWVDGAIGQKHDLSRFMWTSDKGPNHEGWTFGQSLNPGWRHARVVFKKPSIVGTVVVQADKVSLVSVLKKTARYPGRPEVDSDWLPGTRVRDSLISLWVFPPGTVSSAIRLSNNSPEDDKFHDGRIAGIYVLPDSFVDVAPYGTATARTNPAAAPLINDGNWGMWDNGPEGSQNVISKQNPEVLILGWSTKVPLRGLCTVRAGFTQAEVSVYSGPDDRDPALALESHWSKVGVYTTAYQYPRQFGPSWIDFGHVIETKAVRIVITEPEGKANVHPHRVGWDKQGKRVWLIELLALRPTDETPLAEVIAELSGSAPMMAIPPATDGYYLSAQMLANLSRHYDQTSVSPGKLADIGGNVAASARFDSTLKSYLVSPEATVFVGSMGFASKGMRIASALRGLERRLERERPEIVRICFDATDLAKGATAAALEPRLKRIVEAVRERGGVPVLFTLPMMAPTEAAARALIEDYNRMVVGLALHLSVPAVDAYALLNGDPAKAGNYFKAKGQLKDEAYLIINGSFAKLYQTLCAEVIGRNLEVVAALDPEAAPGAAPVADAPKTPTEVAAKDEPDEQDEPDEPDEPEEPAAPAAKPSGTNLVANGGFENWDADSKFAERWRTHSWGDNTLRYSSRIDRNYGHTGERSLVAHSFVEGCRPGAYTTVTLPPGKYEVSYWACADVEEKAKVQCHVGGIDLEANTIGDNWQEFTQTIEIKERILGAGIKLWVVTPKVRVWFDDVHVAAR